MRVPPQGEASEYTNKRPGENSGPFAANNTHIQFRPVQVTTPQVKAPVKSAGHFYPRSPQGERRVVHLPTGRCKRISIHVPRKGNVLPWSAPRLPAYHFYPRSPCGERRDFAYGQFPDEIFLSMFPLRGTSSLMRQIIVVAVISIHVPLAGNVFPLRRQCWVTEGFLSTFPLRGTSISRKILFYRLQISIHVPIAGNVRRP